MKKIIFISCIICFLLCAYCVSNAKTYNARLFNGFEVYKDNSLPGAKLLVDKTNGARYMVFEAPYKCFSTPIYKIYKLDGTIVSYDELINRNYN